MNTAMNTDLHRSSPSSPAPIPAQPRTPVNRTCPRHGTYTATLVAVGSVIRESGCPACREERLEARERVLDEERRAARSIDIKSRLARAAVPPRFRGKSFKRFVPESREQDSALRIVSGYAANFRRILETGTCLILCGTPGTGKTHLACALLEHVIRNGHTGMYISTSAACRRVKETYRRDAPVTESSVLAAFSKPELLVLDEVGVQFGTATERMILFDIINSRYEQLKPTAVVSNLPPNKLADCIGERAVDRLRENGGTVVPFAWASRRTGNPTMQYRNQGAAHGTG